MTQTSSETAPVVVVTGANGLVGSRTCAALLDLGVTVRALVRREGTAPEGTEEHVGEFGDEADAAAVVAGADAVVTTVHPMGSDLDTQRSVAVEGTPAIARAAAEAGVARLVHVSTAAVYDRSPGTGDVDEHGALVGDDAGDYPVTKREADAALAEVGGLTTVLVRPPAILGAAESSIWNALRPAAVREHEQARRANPEQSFAWVHVEDLARVLAHLAAGRVAAGTDPEQGPVEGECTALNVAAEPAALREYHLAVCESVGVEPEWTDEPTWTGDILAGRAERWGFTPRVGLDEALAEVREGLAG